MKSAIRFVIESSRRIKNGRDEGYVLRYAFGEMHELEDEVNNGSNGVDGIEGEAIDVMQCMVDIICVANPNLSAEAIEEMISQRLIAKTRKWLAKEGVE